MNHRSGCAQFLTRSICLAALLIGVSGCRTVPPFGPAELQAPGWQIRQGQAVWHRPQGGPEIAGEILLATRPDGRTFVQFSKNGFPLLVAQSAPNRWEVQIPTENKRYSGRGTPPARLFILHLPVALAGGRLPRGFSWTQQDQEGWRLSNERTGESLEGYFNP